MTALTDLVFGAATFGASHDPFFVAASRVRHHEAMRTAQSRFSSRTRWSNLATEEREEEITRWGESGDLAMLLAQRVVHFRSLLAPGSQPGMAGKGRSQGTSVPVYVTVLPAPSERQKNASMRALTTHRTAKGIGVVCVGQMEATPPGGGMGRTQVCFTG